MRALSCFLLLGAVPSACLTSYGFVPEERIADRHFLVVGDRIDMASFAKAIKVWASVPPKQLTFDPPLEPPVIAPVPAGRMECTPGRLYRFGEDDDALPRAPTFNQPTPLAWKAGWAFVLYNLHYPYPIFRKVSKSRFFQVAND